MKPYKVKIKSTGLHILTCLLLLVLGLVINPLQAQEVKSSIDRDTIKIGEQITYKLEVEADKGDRVVFPSGQSFIPLEVVDSMAVDTFLTKNRIRLTRKYPLTQFDSGAFSIPKQTLIINDEGFYTDSFQVYVQDVVVDTTKQKLYPIKPALDIRKAITVANWLWWLLGGIILAFVSYLIWRARKKIIEKKQDLPPYEKALQGLLALDQTEDLNEGRIKSFYTLLSEILKRYVDEKIDDKALESTTGEFIALLKVYKKEKKLYLKEQVVDSLEAVLKRADLAKFAGIRPDKITAKEDRKVVEENISAFEQAIPEPTEEEKLQNEAYRLAQEQKKKKKKLYFRMAAGVIALLLAVSVFVSIKGLDYAKELVSSQPTKEMLKKDWFKSEYGTFGMTLSTPEILMRKMDTLPEIFPGNTQAEEHFSYGNINSNLSIKVTNIRFKENAQVDSLDVGELLDKALENEDISTLTFKNQEFSTLHNEKGQKVFGNFFLGDPLQKSGEKRAYTFLVFTERGGLQELLITYDPDDEAAKEIENRLTNSVEFKKVNNE